MQLLWKQVKRLSCWNRYSLQDWLYMNGCVTCYRWSFTVLKWGEYYDTKEKEVVLEPTPQKTKRKKKFCTRLRHFHSSVHTHTHTLKHRHTQPSQSVFFFLYDKRGWRQTVSCCRFVSQSPCWTARCHAGSSGGPRRSWRPVTRRTGWRSPPAGLPPRIWTWALGISIQTKKRKRERGRKRKMLADAKKAEVVFTANILTRHTGAAVPNSMKL